jgi:hypothetical protein
MRIRHALIWLGLACLLAALPGCRATGERTYADPVIETSLSEKFEDRRPIDIAVMPVYSAPEDIPPVVRHLRAQIKEQLLDRFYSPVSFQAIDEKLGAFPERRRFNLNQIRGNFDEDALLYASLDRWEKSDLVKRLTVVVSMTLTLYDSRTGDVLWKYRVQDQAVRVPNFAPEESEGGGYDAYVAGLLAKQAFEGFPRKTPPTETDAQESPRE